MNLDDDDLTEDMEKLPEAKDLEDWTATRPQIWLARSALWRLRAVHLVSKQTSDGNDRDEMVRIEKQLLEALGSRPECLDLDIESMAGNRNSDRLASLVLLDLFNRRALLAMYKPLVLSNGWDTDFTIRMNFYNFSLRFLECQAALDPESRDVDAVNTKPCWALLQNLCKHNLVQTALSICFEIECINESLYGLDAVRRRDNTSTSSVNSPRPSTSKDIATLIRIVKNALRLLVRGVAEHGHAIKDILLIAVVLESVRTNAPLADKHASMMEEVLRIIGLCRQQLQKDDIPSRVPDRSYPPVSSNVS